MTYTSIQGTNDALLPYMVQQAKNLHEPGEGSGEYTRGQAELIGDVCGLAMDVAHDVVMEELFSQRTVAESVARIREANSEYRA